VGENEALQFETVTQGRVEPDVEMKLLNPGRHALFNEHPSQTRGVPPQIPIVAIPACIFSEAMLLLTSSQQSD
jgi:hypothetical protein